MEVLNQFFQSRAAEMWIGMALLVLILELWVLILHRRVARLQSQQHLRAKVRPQLTDDEREVILHLQQTMPKSIQKFGMVRFNPFEDTGGDQSFALALTDADGNGLVMSSLHRRGESRVYAKPLAQWQSSYTLSAEEKQALGIARGDAPET